MSDIVERLRTWRHDSWPADPSLEAAAEIERLRAEVHEQARLLGMSGEREARLLARVEVLEVALRRIQTTPHPSVAAQCTSCYSHQKTATYALEDAAP